MRQCAAAIASGLLLLLTCVPFLTAETEPGEPEMVLPPVVLEVEALERDDVRAFLPEGADIMLPALDIPLPEPGDFQISPTGFDISFTDLSTPVSVSGSSFYSEGRIGAGSRNHILGEISLYKLGEDPRFTIHFSHAGMDGYGDKKSGEGFFQRRDVLDGSFRFSLSDTDVYVDTGYEETENGLQQLSGNYSSVIHRYYSAFAGFHHPITESLYWEGGVEAGSANRVLTGTDSDAAAELLLHPYVQIGLVKNKFSLSLRGDYRLNDYRDDSDNTFTSSTLSSTLHGGYQFQSFEIGLEAGVIWDPVSSALTFPFEGVLSGAIRDRLSYRFSGGYRFDPQDYRTLWKLVPFLETAMDSAVSEAVVLGPGTGWLSDGDIGFAFPGGVTLNGGWLFEEVSGRVRPVEPVGGWGSLPLDWGDIGGLEGLVPFYQEDVRSLSLRMGLDWKPVEPVLFSFLWEGQLLDRNYMKPLHSLSGMVEYLRPGGAYGGLLSFRTVLPSGDFDPDLILPDFSLEGFYRIAEGVTLVVEGTDLLAPFASGGRKGWGPYKNPGATLTFMTRITL